jgi:branched-chain amino acid aminotransferase
VILVNGAFFEGNKAELDFSDRGLMLGDGLFETLPVLGGEIFMRDVHLDRLERGLGVLGFSVARSRLESDLAVMVPRALDGYGILRLTVTRGGGSRGLLPPIGPKPTVIVTLTSYSPSVVFEPTTLAVSTIRRNQYSPVSRLKSLAYLDNILALREAGERGARDALMLNGAGNVTSTTVANLFAIFRSELVTPPLADGLIDGVTRGLVLSHAREMGVTAVERSIPAGELKDADCVFLTNSARFIQPVSRIDSTVYSYDLRSRIEASYSLREICNRYLTRA